MTNSSRSIVLGAAAVLVGGVAVAAWVISHPASPPQVPAHQEEAAAPDTAPSETVAEAPPAAPPEAMPAPEEIMPPPIKLPPRKIAMPDPAATPRQPMTVQDARQALAAVGNDPVAEAAWLSYINDTSVAPKDRQNLIEDLNEVGFNDPKHITQDDLPLIESRLSLIEFLGPRAIDETNAKAFNEAYKDLIKMRQKLVGQ